METPIEQLRFQPIKPEELLAKINSQFEKAVLAVGDKVMSNLEKNLGKKTTNPDTYGLCYAITVFVETEMHCGIAFATVADEVMKRMQDAGYSVEYTIQGGTQCEPGSYLKITKVTF